MVSSTHGLLRFVADPSPRYDELMPPLRNLTGQTFGRLKVLSLSRHQRGPAKLWDCVCACANNTRVPEVRSDNLVGLKVKSCGCLRREHPGPKNTEKSKKPSRMLNAEEVQAIRERHSKTRRSKKRLVNKGLTQAATAKEYGVAVQTIWRIVNGHAWKIGGQAHRKKQC